MNSRKLTDHPWKVKREKLYDGPDLGRTCIKDGIMDKREELYDGLDLDQIRVKNDVVT